jgi:hypothetical protein
MNAKRFWNYLTIATLLAGALALPATGFAHGQRNGHHDNGHYGARHGWNHALRQGPESRSRIRVLHEHRDLPLRVERYFVLERPRVVRREVSTGRDREFHFSFRNRRD